MVWPELVLKTGGLSSPVTVVTGASGYIGSHVVANLLARGEKVRATVRDVADPERVDHLRNLPIADGGGWKSSGWTYSIPILLMLQSQGVVT